MLSIVANIFYVLIAIAMTVLILLQRGAGANAGSGFGGGASATVFGARGSANFLSRSTAVLAGLFFLLSLGMGIYLGRDSGTTQTASDLGGHFRLAGIPPGPYRLLIEAAGFPTTEIRPGSRKRPDGSVLEWRTVALKDDTLAVAPFFIQYSMRS